MSKDYTIRLQSLGIRKFEFVAKQKNENNEKGMLKFRKMELSV